jgi:hypothetical protein
MILDRLHTSIPDMGASYYGHKSVGTGLRDLWSFSEKCLDLPSVHLVLFLGYQVPALKFKNTQENG